MKHWQERNIFKQLSGDITLSATEKRVPIHVSCKGTYETNPKQMKTYLSTTLKSQHTWTKENTPYRCAEKVYYGRNCQSHFKKGHNKNVPNSKLKGASIKKEVKHLVVAGHYARIYAKVDVAFHDEMTFVFGYSCRSFVHVQSLLSE